MNVRDIAFKLNKRTVERHQLSHFAELRHIV